MHSHTHSRNASSSSRPTTPASSNSVLTFAESLRSSFPTTPSPTDEEAEYIWETAKNAPPLFPDLDLEHVQSPEFQGLQESSQTPVNYQLGPGQRGIVHDTEDAAGNRQSVLLVYEAVDESATPTPEVEKRSYMPPVPSISQPRPSSPRTATRYPRKPVGSTQPPAPSSTIVSKFEEPIPTEPTFKKRSKPKGTVYKLKQAFKLATMPKAKALTSKARIAQKNDTPTQKPARLPSVRPVQIPSKDASKPGQPLVKKTVGHPDRMTRWADFSQYRSDESVNEPSQPTFTLEPAPRRRRRTPDLNKPLPDSPPAGSHLRHTQAFPPSLNVPNVDKTQAGSSERRKANRRTAVYAGSVFASEDEVINTYGSTPFRTPAATQTFSTHLEAPYKSPQFSESVNNEIGRLNSGFDRAFDPDDEDDKSPMVDTFVHAGHTSFVITERLDENTIRSMYGTQERRDGDSGEDDPTQAIWSQLKSQAGSDGWDTE